jgi:uncharacterized OsmC-like protein/alpha/beta superfamily hydrolase
MSGRQLYAGTHHPWRNATMPTERVSFPGASGARLTGRIDTPVGEKPVAWALFAHCFTCSKDLRAAVTISRALAERRIGVLRFDFTGLGESEGDFADTTFASNVDDLLAAAAFMESQLAAPELLVGHSLGGAAVLLAAGRMPACRAVATVGAPARPIHVERHLHGPLDEVRRTGKAQVSIGGRPFLVRRQLLEDLEAASLQPAVHDLQRALLLFHSPADDIVAIDNASTLFAWARHPKSFISLDHADHLLSGREDAAYVGAVTAAWARRYLEHDPATGQARDWAAGEDRVALSIGHDHFPTEIMAAGHTLVADEPLDAGGSGLGPSPYDLLNAALGACTAITLRIYADRKQWPLHQVDVRLAHGKVHARDDADPGDARIDHISQEIRLRGPLSYEQRQRLREIADRCPVHRTLDAGVKIETTLAAPPDPTPVEPSHPRPDPG